METNKRCDGIDSDRPMPFSMQKNVAMMRRIEDEKPTRKELKQINNVEYNKMT